MHRQQSTTSLNTISSFGQNFEAQVNSNMDQDTQQSASQDHKGKMPARSPSPSMAEDGEYNEKMAMKDGGQHQLPPRFSAIFDTKMPTTPTKAFESYPQQPTRRSGIYIPKAVFWALLIIFLFETAALFAYTVIGLVSNMPSRLVPYTGPNAVVSGCDCNAQQPINISPNFFMPQAPQASDVQSPTSIPSTTTSTSTSSSTTSTSSSSSAEGVNASQLADMIKSVGMIKASSSSTHSPTTRTTVVTPPGSTVQSTTLLTVDASGKPVEPRPTVTSTKAIDASEASASLTTRDEPTSVSTSSPDPTSAAETPKIVPITTNAGTGGIVVSVSMAPVAESSATPVTSTDNESIIITASLKQQADTPTQQPEPAAESTEAPSSEDSVSAPPAPSGCENVWMKSGKLMGVKCT